ncbi:hypothetical protein [Halocalculus aciditolerans]|uniref:Uncharacterized protein n=1 Tax=Halocalculus aciditolerans TaxID=1383812 RepID=A0A830F084_9EURY|nr:hypothetical protein [Halocalculus aciditolerans]GGL48172.1 hypothetical protein GCM10009039_02980 [Halocalculus aciditolerans]
MRRRTFLAAGAVSAAGALAGCSSVLGPSGEWRLRAMRTDPDATERRCALESSFVEGYPKLETVLSRAADHQRGEWADPTYLSASAGNELGAALAEYCGESFRSVYMYEGEAFFVSLTDVNPENDRGHGAGHDHGGGNASGNHTHENGTAHTHDA